MLIRKLILDNFGLFRGRHEIDLAPKVRNGRARPIVLVGGKNGAGKTTLLESVRLALYGPLALGNRTSSRNYEDYLRQRIHRDEAALIQLDAAAVGLEFEYSDRGARHNYEVERAWQLRQNGHLETHLSVLRDGQPLEDLDQESANDFLRDLIPQGVSQLYFFDGEKIQELAESEDDDLTLADAIRGLLGLDLVERLHGDLRIYANRCDDDPEVDPIQHQLADLESRHRRLTDERVGATRSLDESQSRADRCRTDLARIESRLAREGGAFSKKRGELLAERKSLFDTIEELENEIRRSSEDLLPFALAGRLCHSLREQILAEETYQGWRSHRDRLKARIDGMRSSLEDRLFTAKPAIDQAVRSDIASRVVSMLEELAEPPQELPQVEMIHRLSDEQRTRLLSAIDRVFGEVPRHLKVTQAKLEKATRRLSSIEHSLKKVPEDDQLQPVLDQLRNFNQQLAAAEADVRRNETAVTHIDVQLAEIDRQGKKLEGKLADAQSGIGRRAMVAKVREALHEYTQGLTTKKSRELSDAVARRFAQLWRKGDVVRHIEIDPSTFKVILRDRHSRAVPKKELSAGEKQIYAISLLWGLAEVSGRPLPMVIDTPLGRLDADHRSHLVERYFPHASHQVIILSTDTEIDKSYFQEMTPSVSHSFHLQYDRSEGLTTVESGYFWKRQSQDRELAHADQ